MVARCRRGGAGGSARPASMGPEPRSFLRIEFEPAPGQEALFGGRRAAAVARAEQRFLRHREQPRRESRRVRAAVRRCRRDSRHPETRRRTRGLPLDRAAWDDHAVAPRSEEHTSELQSLMRISYAVFCLKKKKP